MDNPGYIVLSQQTALTKQMDVIANNLANVNTPGYRSETMLFNEFLGKATNPGLSGTGARISFVGLGGTLPDTRPGPLEPTSNPLDFGIQGSGYFVVNTPDGPRYTRAGHFAINGQDQLVNADGYQVADRQGRPLSIPQGAANIEVTPTGVLSSDKGPIGQMQIVKFDSDVAMQKVGANLYQTDAPTQAVDTTTQVKQGLIEGSNVQPIIEVSRMIQVQRAYEQANNMITAERDRDLQAIQILTRTS
jgi:flagellar basal-body rod protein FlgF